MSTKRSWVVAGLLQRKLPRCKMIKKFLENSEKAQSLNNLFSSYSNKCNMNNDLRELNFTANILLNVSRIFEKFMCPKKLKSVFI